MARYLPNDDEVSVARMIAQRRNTLNGGGSNIPGGERATQQEREEQHFRGALAEIAVSRLSNRCWTGCGIGANGGKDVGYMLEVRSIDKLGNGLLVRDKDKDTDPCALVFVATDRSCEIVGWAFYGEVKRRGRLIDGDTNKRCWVMPVDMLRPWLDWVEILRWMNEFDFKLRSMQVS